MLIHLYNGKKCQEYVKEYKSIIDIVSKIIINNSNLFFQLSWNKKHFGFDSKELLGWFKNKIQDIVGQVRDKLNKDAKD